MLPTCYSSLQRLFESCPVHNCIRYHSDLVIHRPFPRPRRMSWQWLPGGCAQRKTRSLRRTNCERDGGSKDSRLGGGVAVVVQEGEGSTRGLAAAHPSFRGSATWAEVLFAYEASKADSILLMRLNRQIRNPTLSSVHIMWSATISAINSCLGLHTRNNTTVVGPT